MIQIYDISTSVLASTMRSWRGTSASRTSKQPEKDLILFDQEGCSECRFVREALTELDLNAMIAPCPLGGKNIRKLKREKGDDELPFLVDPNTDQKITGRENITQYLFQQYRGKKSPKALEDNFSNTSRSILASIIRFNAGIRSVKAHPAALPLTLYSFESSPFCRPVRERLCELELPYLLINLGKQQKADMGPANFRPSLKPYQPLPNTKRDVFFQEHGNVQVPFLIDPNTGTEMFESKDIVAYLNRTYMMK